MEIKDLDKKQYILLTLLITFVVSIATGIVTVSLMNQMPKSVPQTINNVIQRTIEKVTTVQVPVPADTTKTDTTKTKESEKDSSSIFDSTSQALVSIYSKNADTKNITSNTENTGTGTNQQNTTTTESADPISLGQGVIISDIGLILVDSSILGEDKLYKVILDKTDFNASVLKKFSNGFTILKISVITDKPTENTDKNSTTEDTGNKTQ